MSAQLDERRGVPSASGMDRLFHCPPSFKMEQSSPKEPENDDAASGTRIHAVLAGLAEYDSLTTDERQTCDMCEAHAAAVVAGWGNSCREWKEVRLGLTSSDNVILFHVCSLCVSD